MFKVNFFDLGYWVALYLCKGVDEPIFSTTEPFEIVGVDGPDHGAGKPIVQDVVGLYLEALLVVVPKPLIALVGVRCCNFFIL